MAVGMLVDDLGSSKATGCGSITLSSVAVILMTIKATNTVFSALDSHVSHLEDARNWDEVVPEGFPLCLRHRIRSSQIPN